MAGADDEQIGAPLDGDLVQTPADGGGIRADGVGGGPLPVALVGHKPAAAVALIGEQHRAAPGRPLGGAVDVAERGAAVGGGEPVGEGDRVVASGTAVDTDDHVVKHDRERSRGWCPAPPRCPWATPSGATAADSARSERVPGRCSRGSGARSDRSRESR